jgi:DNA modification methylase
MTLHYQDDRVSLYHGDCIELMRTLPDASVDAVVTDPPYGLSFMGKDWDNGGKMLGQMATGDEQRGAFAYGGSHDRGYADNDSVGFQAFSHAWATEALRVLKPGGHLLAFGGTRTWHRLAVAIEDAGFEIRDSIAWHYGSGFPKSLDVSKAIDKNNGEFGRLLKFTQWMRTTGLGSGQVNKVLRDAGAISANGTIAGHYFAKTRAGQPTIPTPELWQMIRPLCGDVPAWVDELVKRIAAEREVVGQAAWTNSAQHFVPGEDHTQRVTLDITAPATPAAQQWQGWGTALKPAHEPIVVARKPLIGTVAENVLTHGTGALNIDGCRIGTEQTTTTIKDLSQAHGNKFGVGGIDYPKIGEKLNPPGRWPANVILDESQAAALDAQSGVTASTKRNGERTGKDSGTFGSFAGQSDVVMGHNDSGGASRFFYVAKASKKERPNVNGVAHPTVKPMALMQYLVRLVTPPGGTVLEPFAGSGTTIEAALNEGFNVIGIEMTDEYLPLIMARIERYGDKLC